MTLKFPFAFLANQVKLEKSFIYGHMFLNLLSISSPFVIFVLP